MKQNVLNYLKLIRVKHYIKNFLIFFPLIFSRKIFLSNVINTTYGFISFSLMASTIYIINDIKDKEKDKLHSTKKFRPIASGKISIKKALILSVVLFILSILFSFLASNKIYVIMLLLSYFILNLLYTFKLKNVVVFDVFMLVVFYIIRIYYGALITNVDISNWLYLTIMSAAFYFSFGKRKSELMNENKKREVLNYYSKDYLDRFMYLSLTLTIGFYSLWAMSINISKIVLSIPLLFVIFMRYSLDVEYAKDGDPTEVLFKDKFLILLVCVYIAFIIFKMV